MKHPINRPIRKHEVKSLGFARIPYNEPLTPGLRQPQRTNAIGFTAEYVCSDREPEIYGSKK